MAYDPDTRDEPSFLGRHRGWLVPSFFGGLFVAFILVMPSVTSRVQIQAGHEAVLIDKPFWTMFDEGGIRPDPLPTGSKWLFYTTEVMEYDLRPYQWTEPFDDEKDGTITSDNIPIDFNAYIKVRPIAGKTPRLHGSFGSEWYKKNLKEVFRTAVRDEVAQQPMTALTTRQVDAATKVDVLGNIQRRVLAEMRQFVKDKGIDVEIMEVIIGKATPPRRVLEQLAQTAAEQQRSKTEVDRKNAEIQRKLAEEKRADADNAYRNSIGLSQGQFLQLEIAKQQVLAIKACGESKGCTAIVGELGSAVPALNLLK